MKWSKYVISHLLFQYVTELKLILLTKTTESVTRKETAKGVPPQADFHAVDWKT